MMTILMIFINIINVKSTKFSFCLDCSFYIFLTFFIGFILLIFFFFPFPSFFFSTKHCIYLLDSLAYQVDNCRPLQNLPNSITVPVHEQYPVSEQMNEFLLKHLQASLYHTIFVHSLKKKVDCGLNLGQVYLVLHHIFEPIFDMPVR